MPPQGLTVLLSLHVYKYIYILSPLKSNPNSVTVYTWSSLQFHELVFTLYYFLLIVGCGISTDLEACYTARIMALSIIPFIIVQSLKIFSSSSAERIVILIAIVVSTVFLFLYFFYQVLHSLLISFFSTRDYVSLMWILIVKVLSGAIS